MEIWIGTSGYVYPEWKGVLYARGTSSAKMLTVYAGAFPMVELNFSYYKMPTTEQLSRMAQRVPHEFQFVVKAHKSLTHELASSQIGAFADCLIPLRTSNQLAGVLCQFPERFHWSATNFAWIANLYQRLGEVPLAVEFRHVSWDRRYVEDWLRERNIILVSVDVPDLPTLYPRKLVQTSRTIYIRLHSRRASCWHRGGADRYDYAYSDAELQSWIDGLSDRTEHTDRAMIFFNNCRHANAVINARRLEELLARIGQSFDVISPTSPILMVRFSKPNKAGIIDDPNSRNSP